MKKITLILLLCFFLISNAQDTFYYKLTKYQHNGILTTNVSGGQFITFLNDICYESDKKGIGLGHGTLQLNKNYSNEDYYLYMGSSYWGSSTTFKFKHDMSMLNVVTDDGDIYVYKRISPPIEVKTSSLIRKKEITSGGSGYSPTCPVQPTYPQGGYVGDGTNNATDSSGSSSYNGGKNRKKSRIACSSCKYTNGDCSVCKGSGRQHNSTYGVNSTKQCTNCKGTGKCPTCGGDGWID